MMYEGGVLLKRGRRGVCALWSVTKPNQKQEEKSER